MRFSDKNVWQRIKLNEYADFLQGLTYTPNNVSTTGRLVLRSSNIQNSKLVFDDNVYVNMNIPAKISTKENDVLMCVRNGSKNLVGKTALITKEFENLAWGAFMNIIRPKDGKTLLFHFLNSQYFKNQIKADLNTATVNQITIGTLNQCKISIPLSEIEKDKLCIFFNLLDQRIDAQSKIIEDLELFKKGIENQYFSCNKNNEYVILGDVITQINNRNEKNIDFEVLSVSNKYGFIPQSEQFDDHEVASANKSNYKIVKQNDFAYNPARINVGSIAMLRNNQVGIVSPMYICFRANNNRILSSYLDYFSHSNKFNNEVLKNLEGSVRLCLSFESLSKIKIHLPSLDTQYEIVKNLDLISNKISIENKILEKLKEQKKYLLSNMFI